MEKQFKFLFLLSFIFISSINVFSQEVNIVPYLKQIDNGQKVKALSHLAELKDDYPDDPSVMFLEGVLTENGQDAVAIYTEIINEYPNSKYADAAVFRIYSYYYALGLYGTANSFLNRLKKDYPKSPYIKIAEQRTETTTMPLSAKKKPLPPKSKNKIIYNYTIQAGAFTISANAGHLKTRFENAGFYSTIKDKNVAGTIFHVVYVGKFETEESAKKALNIIDKQFNLQTRVTTISK
ncbi:MAG: SPOR domain-containing protein [Bacteroidetes bacterium]|nr:SPOR domain-containing protein [Bacteroidota bacterium]MCH8169824.1 SPOR domain-containing protein [Bacteroidota bacterium]MCH8940949.1 SPOR domain-containing protein [Bacteroidota bacterium]